MDVFSLENPSGVSQGRDGGSRWNDAGVVPEVIGELQVPLWMWVPVEDTSTLKLM